MEKYNEVLKDRTCRPTASLEPAPLSTDFTATSKSPRTGASSSRSIPSGSGGGSVPAMVGVGGW
eukprot:scaffold18510_cov73-Cylindrotheca_fusiformis.AAC.1